MSIPIRRPAKDNEIVNTAMKSSCDVNVFQHRRILGKLGRSLFFGFEPKKSPKGIGFIIYPGTLVDVTAYAPIAKFLAEKGYHVALATPPLSLASFDFDLADDIIKFGWKDDVKTWVVSGHSQGGAIACTYAKKRQGSKLKGVILLAAYAGDTTLLNGNLSETDYKVLSIYGSVDGIALYDKVVVVGATRLPQDAKFVKIEGGNHTQFSYAEGLQESGEKKDGVPTITLEAQQELICNNVLEFLSHF